MIFIPNEDEDIINGASLVNPPRQITSEKLGEVKRINAEWVALIPYAFSREGEPSVSFDHSRQWWGEHTDGNCMLIQYAKNNGLKVMVKPHVWARGAGWVGEYDLDSEEKWKIWETDYTKYIMNHAIKADSLKVELFCIGTEYRIPAKERPEFWRSLIAKVRKVYSGKITYASNWDNYENITWWDAVDYIGIDAYFPLVDGNHPSIDEIKMGWKPIKEDLATFSSQWKKPILFTEYGFQSANGAVGRHWEIDKSETNANTQLQADAYEATFQVFTNESWWLGGFFWKWHLTSGHGRWRGTEWTPQSKPAEEVIAKWYGKKH
ncbi:glycoside hydrolase family 113 [Ekhidna sp.]|uniref:glycoside hydrolase family 113 n=1 Tax=Ekhidna sp. TaxID=2608089 RepID=UPI003B5087DC